LTTRHWLRVGARLVARAGWAPITVVLVHALISRGLKLYGPFPHLDVPMHFLGGASIAYFVSRCFAALPASVVMLRWRAAAEALVAFCVTATSAVIWEFLEWFADRYLGTNAQKGLSDTLLDLAMGLAGGAAYLLVAWGRCALGKIDLLQD
jgi:hypothetical protein